jgi:hypothetical protein
MITCVAVVFPSTIEDCSSHLSLQQNTAISI